MNINTPITTILTTGRLLLPQIHHFHPCPQFHQRERGHISDHRRRRSEFLIHSELHRSSKTLRLPL